MTSLYHPRPERWPQVSLKGFFALVTLVGALCWLGVQMKWIRDRHEAIQWAVRNHLRVGTVRVPTVDGGGDGDEPPSAPWSIRILGEPGIKTLRYNARNDGSYSDSTLKSLFPEASVEGWSRKIEPSVP